MEETNTYQLKPGFLVIANIRTVGGQTSYKQVLNQVEVNEGAGVQAEHKTTITIDNVLLKAEGHALANAARYALRSTALETPIGYYCSKETLETLREEMNDFREQAERFNYKAAVNNSATRVTVRFTTIPLTAAGPECAEEMFAAVRDRLGRVKYHLSLAGNVTVAMKDRLKARKKAGELLSTEARNLDQLACGILRFTVQDALSAAKAAHKELGKAFKDEREPVLDLGPIEGAIDMFTNVNFENLELTE